MTRLALKIYKWGPIRYLIQSTKKVILPGVEGASLYLVGKFFFREMKNLKLTEKAAAVTYNFLMAMPPTFLILFSLVPYLPIKDFDQRILATIRLASPNDNTYNSIANIVIDFIHTQRNDVLSYGIVLVLYFSSNGIMGLMRSFDKSLSLYKKRTGLSRRWTAVKLTLLLILVFIISQAVLVIQSEVLNVWVIRIFKSLVAVKLVSMLILMMVIFCVISIIYTYGPSLTHRFKFVSAGSVVATLLSMITTYVFFFLVNNFLNYNKVYGSIGTLTAFMVWLWLNTLVILIGYELNVSILLGKLSLLEDEETKDIV